MDRLPETSSRSKQAESLSSSFAEEAPGARASLPASDSYQKLERVSFAENSISATPTLSINTLPKLGEKLSDTTSNTLPKLEIQKKQSEPKSNREQIPEIYRPALKFEDPALAFPAKKTEPAKNEIKKDPLPTSSNQNPAKSETSSNTFVPSKRKEEPTNGDSTQLPKLPPLVIPMEPIPAQKPPINTKKTDWFPMPEIRPSADPKDKIQPTLPTFVPRDYSGERRTAPEAPRDTTAAAYWRGRSISDPELVSKGILEQSYVREVMSRHPDAVLIGENGNIRYMNSTGEFTLKHNVPLWMPRAAGQAFIRAQQEATRNGVPIRLEDGPRSYNPAGRTNSQQQSAVRTARIAARVGASRHQGSGAADIMNWNNPVVQRALRNNGWQHGDGRGPIANDYHHWSFAG